MSHPITYFNGEEKDIIMELARMSLADSGVRDRFAEALDLSDDILDSLQYRLEHESRGVDIYADDDF